MEARYNLTESLEIIMNGGDVTDPVMQVLGSKKIVSNNSNVPRYRLLLSDGKYSISCAMINSQTNEKVGGKAIQNFAIIKLKRYITNLISTGERDTRILLILDVELVAIGEIVGQKIGNPIALATISTSSSQSLINTNDSNSPVNLNKYQFNQIFKLSLNQAVTSPIASLSPFHNNWVIKARVSNKSNIRTWSNAQGEGKLFTVNLMDESGEIRCTAFRDLVDKFYDSFELEKVYYVSKCNLKEANKQFSISNSNYEMVLTQEALVEECKEDSSVPQIKYNFVSIDKIATTDSGKLVDVIGICQTVNDIQVFTSKISNREFKKRDLVLIDQSETAVSLTLWGPQAESFSNSDLSVVLVKNAKIGEFRGGKHLTTTTNSQLKINPEIPESLRLKAWYQLEGYQLQIRNISEWIGGRLSLLQVPWMTFQEVQVQQLGTSDRVDYYQTVASVLLSRSDKMMVYKACPNPECNKKIIDMENGMYRCEKCNREYPNFKYRLLFSVNLADSTSNQWATVFASEAEKILGKTSEEIGVTLENDPEAPEQLVEAVSFKQFVFKCQTKTEIYNDEERLKTVVVKADPINYQEYNSYLVEKIDYLIS